MTRALIVDGYELFRMTLADLVGGTCSYDEVEEAGSSDGFVRAAMADGNVGLLVIHPRSIGLGEAECLRLAGRLFPEARIVLFSDSAAASDAARPGVTVLPRAASCDDVVAAIGARRRSGNGDDGADDPCTLPTQLLSQRQRQIMAMVAEGLANKEIAHRLGIAEGTVKAHIHAVFKALGVTNRTQAVVRYGPALRAAC